MRGDSAPALQTIECDQDGEAINYATALLDAKPEHYGIEIWKDSRLLARVAKGVSNEQHRRTRRRLTPCELHRIDLGAINPETGQADQQRE